MPYLISGLALVISFAAIWLWSEFSRQTGQGIDARVEKHINSLKEIVTTVRSRVEQIVERHNELEQKCEENAREIRRLTDEIALLRAMPPGESNNASFASKSNLPR